MDWMQHAGTITDMFYRSCQHCRADQLVIHTPNYAEVAVYQELGKAYALRSKLEEMASKLIYLWSF